jgi:AbrB family looped-hinge helix DNA binding protein
MQTTTLDRFGRIILPKALRERLGMEAGAVLEIVEEGGRSLRLTLVPGDPHLAKRGAVLVYRGKAVGDVDGAVHADRTQRLKKLTPRSTK